MRPPEPLPVLPLVASLCVGSAGVDLVRAIHAGRGLLWGDVAPLVVVGCLGALPFLLPAMLIGAQLRRYRTGWLLGSALLLHGAVYWRFGPMVNTPTKSLSVLGGWALLGVVTILAGAWLSARLDALPRRAAWAPAALLPLGLLWSASQLAVGAEQGRGDGPNVLFITLDTLRMDRVGAYGSDVPTPALDALAARGVVFEQAIAAAPLTGPSHRALLSGRHPMSTGVVANGTAIGPSPSWLPSLLRDAGWQTGGFVGGYPLHGRFGFDLGFDTYDADFASAPGLHHTAPVLAIDALLLGNVPRERVGDRVVQRFERWVSRTQGAWFAWVHLYDPHGPYEAPGAWRDARTPDSPRVDGEALDLPSYWPASHRAVRDVDWLTGRYEAEVMWTDELVRRVLALAETHGDGRGTVVVLTADHGESLTEHGILFDHGDDLYDPALRVPLILAGPGLAPGRVPCQVPAVDVQPTLVQWLELSDAAPVDGVSQLAVARGARCTDRDAYATTVGARRADPPIDHALRWPHAKYIAHESRDDRWFDLLVDPEETVNALSQQPTRAEPMRALLERRVARGAPTRAADVDAQSQQLLEELGYVERP